MVGGQLASRLNVPHLHDGEVSSQVVLPPDVGQHGVGPPVAVRVLYVRLILHKVQLLAKNGFGEEWREGKERSW